MQVHSMKQVGYVLVCPSKPLRLSAHYAFNHTYMSIIKYGISLLTQAQMRAVHRQAVLWPEWRKQSFEYSALKFNLLFPKLFFIIDLPCFWLAITTEDEGDERLMPEWSREG